MEDIEALLKATIQTKVVEAFNTTPDMVEKLVRAAFEQEVDKHGQKPSGYCPEKMPWIDWLVGNEIRRAATEAMREHLAQHKDALKAQVAKAITSGALGEQVAAQLGSVLATEYNWQITVHAGQQDT